MYTLDQRMPVFAALRELWMVDQPAQSLLALLCVLARDPGLRATAGADPSRETTP